MDEREDEEFERRKALGTLTRLANSFERAAARGKTVMPMAGDSFQREQPLLRFEGNDGFVLWDDSANGGGDRWETCASRIIASGIFLLAMDDSGHRMP